jgi:hypothetical protein
MTDAAAAAYWNHRAPAPEKHVAGISLTLTRALGPYGSAYDPIGVPLRAYTYEHQPANGVAWNLGCAVSALRKHPSAGDPIDDGLYLLKEMQARGLGVFEVEAKAVEPQASRYEGVLDKPAQVGNVRFHEGVPVDSVVRAAQRYFAQMQADRKPLTCQCENSVTDPCIVCGKGKTLVTAEWLQKMAAREGELDCTTGSPAPQHHVEMENEIARVVQSVNEWDDRTSPPDYPEHLLITSEELAEILRTFAATLEGSDNG